MRYKFYRERKYVSFLLHEVERLVAKTDFRTASQVHRVQKEFTFSALPNALILFDLFPDCFS